jgi:hypothetical protein
LAIVMAGCGGSNLQWAKPGASLQQAKQDGVECRQISRQPSDVPVGGVSEEGPTRMIGYGRSAWRREDIR